jgi:hypothetical protein
MRRMSRAYDWYGWGNSSFWWHGVMVVPVVATRNENGPMMLITRYYDITRDEMPVFLTVMPCKLA